MHLKKIELVGFKSFADRTEVNFEPGVTCIVGPNGCGKSNISDSIRWVLGERSAKLLRGSRMEDVIFSGTDFRKSLNFAEVSLAIDNSDQKLPIQYEEVVITRRLHRSGESEYLINRTPCRLKDIQDLILDTGIGSNSYSMIEQGRIDYILNAEADEKRFLIEEAAGISKYKVKKEEALRKLEHTDENLLRLNDILSEVERNIRYAERQAQRAQRYKEQLERLKKLEIQKAFFEVGGLDAQLNDLEEERSRQTASLLEIEQETGLQNEDVRKLETELQQLEQEFLEQESARSQSKEEFSTLDMQEKFHHEKLEFIKFNSEKALGEIESLEHRSKELEGQIEIKSAELSAAGQIIDQLKTQRDEDEQSAQKSFSQARADQFSNQQSLLFELARKISELKNSLTQNQLELASLERAKTTLRDSREKLEFMKQSLTEQGQGTGKQRHEFADQLTRDHESLEQLAREVEASKSRFEQCRNELDLIRQKKTNVETQLLLLKELEHAGGPDPKTIIAQHGSHPSLQGTLKNMLDLVEIQAGYELAAEAILADALRAVVAENTESAARLIQALKESDSHRATIFIKDRAVLNGALVRDSEAESHPLVKKRLWDAVRIQKGYDAIFGNLLGRVYVVDEISSENISELTRLAQRVRIVSKSGAIIGPEFQITLRSGKASAERSPLFRSQEIERLKKDLSRSTSDEQVCAQEAARLRTQNAQLEEQLRKYDQQVKVSQVSVERLKGMETGISDHANRLNQELSVMAQEERQVDEEIELLRVKQQNFLKQLAHLDEENAAAQAIFEGLKKEYDHQKHAQDELDRTLNQADAKLEFEQSRWNEFNRSLSFLNDQLQEHTSRIRKLVAEREDSGSKIALLQQELHTLSANKTVLHQTLLERSVQSEHLRRRRADLIASRNGRMESCRMTAQKLAELKQSIHERHLQSLQLHHKKDSLCQDLQSRYKINLLALNPEDFHITKQEYESLHAFIEPLREKLESLGTVNLLAIEEFQELKTRYDFLNNQKQDLTQARESLLEAIRKINRTTKKLFEDTLVRVREFFREYFRILFGGGQADLILLDELNPLESGIDIVARPPGKKLQHISLLSGGEKALTAIALLLALFAVKPSPFCVLDEVDASLDEANNDRFLQVLKPFLSTTQFIIVTHSRKTIAMGNVLYGITMQEPGISKVVSVRLGLDSNEIEHTDQKVAQQLNHAVS